LKRPAKSQKKDVDDRKELVRKDDRDTSDEEKDKNPDAENVRKRPSTKESGFDLRSSKN